MNKAEKELRKESEDKKPFWKKGWVWFILLVILFYAVVFSAIDPLKQIERAKKSVSENANITPTPAITEDYKNNLAQTFCNARSKPSIRSVNLDDFILMYEKSGQTVQLRPANGAYPTTENCQKIIDICLKLWEKKECEDIAATNIWIGMDKEELILSWGLPKDRNNSVYSFGVNSQWVYGNFGPYVYLEGKDENSMKVTSWQD